MKHCKRCGLDKPLEEFNKKRNSIDGLQHYCRSCYKTYTEEWDSSDRGKDSSKKKYTKYYGTIKGRGSHLFNNALQRSKRNEIEFTLTREWVTDKLNAGVCEVTGIPFVYSENEGKGHSTNSFSPSIDRIDQNGPYSNENCQMTCWIYNRAKGAFPIADLRLMLESLKD